MNIVLPLLAAEFLVTTAEAITLSWIPLEGARGAVQGAGITAPHPQTVFHTLVIMAFSQSRELGWGNPAFFLSFFFIRRLQGICSGPS